MSEEEKTPAALPEKENGKSEKEVKHYISGKESRRIAKENREAVKELQKKRASYRREDYVTQMRDNRNIVEFEDLHTYFYTDNGVVKAVNGVSYDVPQGSTVGVVGESGCGKSVSSLSLMQLVQGPSGQIVSGSIRFKSQEFQRDEKGRAVPCYAKDGEELLCSEIVLTCEPLAAAPEKESETVETAGWAWLPAFKRGKHGYLFEEDGEGNAFPVYETEYVDGVFCVKFDPVSLRIKQQTVGIGQEKRIETRTGKKVVRPVFLRDEEGRLVAKTAPNGQLSPVFRMTGEEGKKRVAEEKVLLCAETLVPVFRKNGEGETLVAYETKDGVLCEEPVRTATEETVTFVGTKKVPVYARDEKGNVVHETDERGRKSPVCSGEGEEGPVRLKVCKKPVQLRDENGGAMFETKNVVYDVTKMPVKDMTSIRGREIAMIFQEPMTSLNPVFTIGYQLDEVTLLHVNGATKADAKARSLEMLELVGIAMPEHVYKSYPHQLSGGMRQRVMIAMALCCNPKLIIADEPTTALDVTIQAQILDLLRDVKQKISGSIMLITHDLGVIAEMVDYVVVMYAGRIVEKGTVNEIFKDPLHPYTVGLQKSKPVVRRKVDRLYSIPGNVPNPINMPSYCYFRGRCNRRCEKCAGDYPPLIQVSPTHYVACWRAEETLREREAQARAEEEAAKAKAKKPARKKTEKSTEETK